MKIWAKAILVLVAVNLTQPSVAAASDDEPLADQIRSLTKHQVFDLHVLIKPVLRYSLYDDDFQGGRTFEMNVVAFVVKGSFDLGFYYFVHVNMAREPNLLDAFIGYRHSESFRLSAGAMKPKQTLDFIPDPSAIDFVDRAKITGLLVQSRQVGVSVEGDFRRLYYFAGLFNGTGLSRNNNNRFYGISRLQYRIPLTDPGSLLLGMHGSYGNTPGVRSGLFGPVLRGERKLIGFDTRMETNRGFIAAEYTKGFVAIEDVPNDIETISGYFFSSGFQVTRNTMLLARWQSWAFKQLDSLDKQLTVGMNHDFSSMTKLQLNFDIYFPEKGERQFGMSLAFQVKI